MISPDALPRELLSLAEPDETALLDVLRPRISRLMLQEIAENDCGEESSEHLAGIENQISSMPTLGRLEWCPREVLELERWNEPKRGSGERDQEATHWKRLLACTILLRNAGYLPPRPARLSDDDFFLETSATSVIRMLRSALALGSFCHRPVLAFKLWLYDAQPYPRLRPFIALSAALLGIAISGLSATPELQSRLLAWANSAEESCRTILGSAVESERRFIGLSAYESRPELWLDTVRWISSQPKYRSDGPLLSWAETYLNS